MPTYEYRCPNGHEFEKFFRSISGATAENPCPTCGALGVRQLSGGAGLMFKGSGFYLTDYGRNAHASKGPAPKGGDGSGTGGAAPAGEGKSGAGESGGSATGGASKTEGNSSSSGGGGESGGASSTPKPKTSE